METNHSVMWINVFTAKPGKLDELVNIQAEELLNFKDNGVPGWMSSRWHRSVEGNKAIMITTFEHIDFHKSWLEKTDFSEHLNKVTHLIERAEGGYYTLVASVDNS
ncbi:hypothetical protein IC619_000285 [Hazenella sp. IB182353]|uniref:hypothetical protein n=1 Tax=Polycladospora coralii TaxID=2771432 RepID=UPI00174747A0|nr:hypothetical protein [Polycladospora coralii]MBS7528929.1 hypothetical protein [Polycladospora coralii]